MSRTTNILNNTTILKPSANRFKGRPGGTLGPWSWSKFDHIDSPWQAVAADIAADGRRRIRQITLPYLEKQVEATKGFLDTVFIGETVSGALVRLLHECRHSVSWLATYKALCAWLLAYAREEQLLESGPYIYDCARSAGLFKEDDPILMLTKSQTIHEMELAVSNLPVTASELKAIRSELINFITPIAAEPLPGYLRPYVISEDVHRRISQLAYSSIIDGKYERWAALRTAQLKFHLNLISGWVWTNHQTDKGAWTGRLLDFGNMLETATVSSVPSELLTPDQELQAIILQAAEDKLHLGQPPFCNRNIRHIKGEDLIVIEADIERDREVKPKVTTLYAFIRPFLVIKEIVRKTRGSEPDQKQLMTSFRGCINSAFNSLASHDFLQGRLDRANRVTYRISAVQERGMWLEGLWR